MLFGLLPPAWVLRGGCREVFSFVEPVSLMDISLVAFKATCCAGALLSDMQLKSWGSNPLLLKEKLRGVSPLLRAVVDGVCLGFSFSVGFLLVCIIHRSHSTNFLFFRGNSSLGSCRFGVCMGGEEFRILLCHFLIIAILIGRR